MADAQAEQAAKAATEGKGKGKAPAREEGEVMEVDPPAT